MHEYSIKKGTNNSWNKIPGFKPYPHVMGNCSENTLSKEFRDFPVEVFYFIGALAFSLGDRFLPTGLGDVILDQYYASASSWPPMDDPSFNERRRIVYDQDSLNALFSDSVHISDSDRIMLHRLNKLVSGLTKPTGNLSPFDILVSYSWDKPINLLARGQDGKKHPCLDDSDEEMLKKYFSEGPPKNCQRSLNLTEGNLECCKLKRSLEDNPELVFKVMKYTLSPVSRVVYEAAERRDVAQFLSELDYATDHLVTNSNPVVVACKFAVHGEPHYNCSHFVWGYTRFGIGYIFNAPPFDAMYRDTTVNMAFHKEFVEGTYNLHLPRNISERGGSFKVLEVVLDPSALTIRGEDFMSPRVVVHNPWDLGDISKGVDLEPGYTYIISVKLSVVVSQTGVTELPIEKRNCKKDNEDDISHRIFKKYR